MGSDVLSNRINSGITLMAHQSDKIGDDIHVDAAPATKADPALDDDDIKQAPPSPEAAKAAPPTATAVATTEGDGCDGGRRVASDISAANSTTTTQHDAIFNSKVSFPLNLTRMLESVESKGLSHIVHWSENEKSFVICDIDSFLKEVLPFFFKSSENTKIRSFYRKLNRWGFSMARKNAYNPNNVWHHPEFNRSIAVISLNESLEKGKAVDFLHMSTSSKGKNRKRGADESKECELSIHERDDSMSSMSTVGGDCSDLNHPILRKSAHIDGVASMPTLPSARSSMISAKKSRTLSLNCSLLGPRRRTATSNNFLHLRNNQPKHRSATMGNLRSKQSQSTSVLGQGRPPFREGTPNATFDLLPRTAGAAGMPSSSLGNLAPSPNIFALSAQEMLSFRGASSAFGGSRLPSVSGYDNGSSLSGAASNPFRGHLLRSEMTEEEDNELMAFFGSLAETLPPPKEGDEEECAGEPDPLPHNF